MGLRPLEICSFFQCGDRLYTSESAVYRRQILTYKDGSRAESLSRLTNDAIRPFCGGFPSTLVANEKNTVVNAKQIQLGLRFMKVDKKKVSCDELGQYMPFRVAKYITIDFIAGDTT